MPTLILAALLLMQSKPADTLKPKEPEKKEVVVATEAEEAAFGVAGRGPLIPVTINEELSVRPVGARAWVIEHSQPWAANSLLTRMPDGTLVLCDTPYDDQATSQVIGWIRKTFGDDVKIVAINSHYHADALGGNGALRKAEVTSYGSKMTAQMLKDRGAKLKKQLLVELADNQELVARFENVEWLPPAEQFDPATGLELSFGDEKIELYYPGPGHSPDNIVVWFPTRRMLFGGCLVRAGSTIPNVADADLAEWPRSIEKLRRFNIGMIVPGHGRVGGPGLLDHTLTVIAEHQQNSRD